MKRINRDSVTAVLLLLLCGIFFWQTFNIREVPFSEMGSDVWPRFVLMLLSVLSVIYLLQSLACPPPEGSPFSFSLWLRTYKNPIICFVMFALFLLTLPFFGMLAAGILFVFVTQSILGGWSARQLMLHALISIGSVGGMWAIFTYALGVLLPRGELFS